MTIQKGQYKALRAAGPDGLVYRTLRESGTTLGEAGRLMTFAEFNDLIGVGEKYALAERYGAES